MSKSSYALKLMTLAVTTVASLLPIQATKADATFSEVNMVQTDVIAVSQTLPPLFGIPRFNLLVIEQIPGRNTCWQEVGENPTNVNLLLSNFDFTGHCRRATDANGYSIRYNGQDYGQSYILNLVESNGVLNLIGFNPNTNTRINIGTTTGMNGQPMKINLNPGWQLTKRAYQGKVLGHFYFSYQEPATTQNNTLPENNTLPDGNVRDIVAPSN
ncbi:MAG: DUF3747 domain-containing protein [Cyanobacterium sp. T60_A2020_053]|nr:DUF3747 domain-containing protein [Cyanobacterium sp. T60_A2020_053]